MVSSVQYLPSYTRSSSVFRPLSATLLIWKYQPEASFSLRHLTHKKNVIKPLYLYISPYSSKVLEGQRGDTRQSASTENTRVRRFKGKTERAYCFLKSQTPQCCIMDPNKSASAPPQEKSSMGPSPPPPYYYDNPNQGYSQPGPGQPPQPQVSSAAGGSHRKGISLQF